MSRLVAGEATVIYQFITNFQASFHLWWKKDLLKLKTFSKYYDHGCSTLENKNYEDLGKFRVKFSWNTWITIKKYWCNTSVGFSKNVGDNPLNLSLVNLGQWRKKRFNVSISELQIQLGLRVSKKLCLNLYSFKWLRPMRRRVRKVTPFGWLTLKTSLLRGLMKFKIFFFKVKYEGELRIPKSNLFIQLMLIKRKNYGKRYSFL